MTRPWGIGLSDYRPRRKGQEIACKGRRLAKMRDDPADPFHGTPTGYNYGCRCARCRAAKRGAVYRWRFKRKVREIMKIGYLVCDIGGGPIMVCADEADAKGALEMIGAAKEYRRVMVVPGEWSE